MKWEGRGSYGPLCGAVLALVGGTAENHLTCQGSHGPLCGAVLALAGGTADNHETFQSIFGADRRRGGGRDIYIVN